MEAHDHSQPLGSTSQADRLVSQQRRAQRVNDMPSAAITAQEYENNLAGTYDINPQAHDPPGPQPRLEGWLDAPPHHPLACMLCLDLLDNVSHFYDCPRCADGRICYDCLPEWFKQASKDESKMPPMCCHIIPLSMVSDYLQPAQIKLYQAKFEEWTTFDKIYCPVPTCSTFIPARLYSTEPATASLAKAFFTSSQRNCGPISKDGIAPRLPELEELFDKALRTEVKYLTILKQIPLDNIKPRVDCPTCKTPICTKCHSFTHGGECQEGGDLDPTLGSNLSRWKVKRCPKCRNGVRKAFGCSHIECRCGCHFCWECLKTMEFCDGSCADKNNNTDPAPAPGGQAAEDTGTNRGLLATLRGLLGRGSREPSTQATLNTVIQGDPATRREFADETDMAESEDLSNSDDTSSLECEHKFVLGPPYAKVYGAENEIDSCDVCEKMVIAPEGPETGPDLELRLNTEMMGYRGAWQCMAGHMKCERCINPPVPYTAAENARKYTCDCGKKCEDCEKQVKKKSDKTAWDCHCGMVVCGACKDMFMNLGSGS